ncbi:hypothetical protein DYB32_009182, partial [Aphanomyces invadans]
DDVDYDEMEFLIDVFVPTQTIRSVAFGGSDTLTVNPRVLANATDAHVIVTALSDGDMFLQDSDLAVSSVSLVAVGSGDIQWVVPALAIATSLNVQTTSAGDVTLVAETSLSANSVEVNVLGSGDISLSSANLTVPQDITTNVLGSGGVVYQSHGACGHHKLSVLGSGHADTSAIACETTNVLAVSSGDIYVTATKELVVSRLGTASVYVSRPEPPIASGDFKLVDAAAHDKTRTSTEDIPRHEVGIGDISRHSRSDHVGLVVILLLVVVIVQCCKRCCCKRKANKSAATIALQPQHQPVYYHGGQDNASHFYPSTGAPAGPTQPPPQPPTAPYAYYAGQHQPSASYSGTSSYTPLTQSLSSAPYQQLATNSHAQPSMNDQGILGRSAPTYPVANPAFALGPQQGQPTAPAYPTKF